MQQDLFDNNQEPNKTPPERDNDFEWRQFVKLGDMMGDGLHHEADGKWITKEYNRLAKILIPEIKESYQQKRKQKTIRTNEQIAKLILDKKCNCGGGLEQRRSGTKIVYCIICDARYKAVSKKK